MIDTATAYDQERSLLALQKIAFRGRYSIPGHCYSDALCALRAHPKEHWQYVEGCKQGTDNGWRWYSHGWIETEDGAIIDVKRAWHECYGSKPYYWPDTRAEFDAMPVQISAQAQALTYEPLFRYSLSQMRGIRTHALPLNAFQLYKQMMGLLGELSISFEVWDGCYGHGR